MLNAEYENENVHDPSNHLQSCIKGIFTDGWGCTYWRSEDTHQSHCNYRNMVDFMVLETLHYKFL